MTFISGNKFRALLKPIFLSSIGKELPLIITMGAAFLLLQGCLPKQALMNPDMPVQQLPRKFFAQLPQLLQLDHKKKDLSGTVEADANLLAASFTEKYIEKDNLLTYSSLGEKSSYPVADYDDMVGASQQLFLYHIQTAPDKLDAVVYLAARYNEDGKCIGLGSAYLGYLDTDEGHIDFLFSLSVKVKNGDTCLVADKKLAKLKKLAGQHRFATRIVFLSGDLKQSRAETTAAYWKRLHADGIRVSKVIEYDPNKVGGKQPVIFTINEIMKDEQYLQFLPKKDQP